MLYEKSTSTIISAFACLLSSSKAETAKELPDVFDVVSVFLAVRLVLFLIDCDKSASGKPRSDIRLLILEITNMSSLLS